MVMASNWTSLHLLTQSNLREELVRADISCAIILLMTQHHFLPWEHVTHFLLTLPTNAAMTMGSYFF